MIDSFCGIEDKKESEKMGRVRKIPASESLAATDFQSLIKQEKNAKVRVKLIALDNIKKGSKSFKYFRNNLA